MTTSIAGDRYAIEGEVGRGAMGVVYRAFDTALERHVAIKVLSPSSSAGSDEQQARFRREARVAAGIRHENIVTVHEFIDDGATMAMVMEFVDGASMDALLASRGRLPASLAADLTRQLLSGLEAAHRRGLVHRDIKPSNVLVTDGLQVKLADFGIAKFGGDTLTAHGQVFGTLGYVAPEVFRGAAADARSDLFSVGCLAFELVEGRAAFTGESAAAVMNATLSTEASYAQDLWQAEPTLAMLVHGLLEKEPRRRVNSAESALAVLRGERSAASPSDAATCIVDAERRSAEANGIEAGRSISAPIQTVDSHRVEESDPTLKSRDRSLPLLAGAAVLAVLVTMSLGWQLLRNDTVDNASSVSGESAPPSSPSQTSGSSERAVTAPPANATGIANGATQTQIEVTPARLNGGTPTAASAGDAGDPDGINVSPKSVRLDIGDEQGFDISGSLDSPPQVVSLNPAVATVNRGENIIRAVGRGTTEIAVTVGAVSRRIAVTVLDSAGSPARDVTPSQEQLNSRVEDAVRSSDVRALKSALEAGGDANINIDGRPALVVAAEGRSSEVVRWLQLCGAPTRGSVAQQAIGASREATVRQHLLSTEAGGIARQRCGLGSANRRESPDHNDLQPFQ